MINIFFDFDGTLLSVNKRYFEILKDFLKQYNNLNLKISIKKFIKLKRKIKYENIIVKNIFNIDINLKDFLNFKHSNLENINYLKFDKLIGNPQKIFIKLKKLNCNIFLVTMRNNKENLLKQLKDFNILNYFTDIIIVNPEEKTKIYALEKFKDTNSYIIGDSNIDIETGLNLNFISCFVKTGLFSQNKIINIQKCYILNNYAKIIKIIKKRKNK